MKAIDYIEKYSYNLKRDTLQELLEEEGVELTDELWNYLIKNLKDINYGVLKNNFGIDINKSNEVKTVKEDIYEVKDKITLTITNYGGSYSLEGPSALLALEAIQKNSNLIKVGGNMSIRVEDIISYSVNPSTGKVYLFKPTYKGDIWAVIKNDAVQIYSDDYFNSSSACINHSYKEWEDIFKNPWNYELILECKNKYILFNFYEGRWMIEDESTFGEEVEFQISNFPGSYISISGSTSSMGIGYIHVNKKIPKKDGLISTLISSSAFTDTDIQVTSGSAVSNYSFDKWSEICSNPLDYEVIAEIDNNLYNFTFSGERWVLEINNEKFNGTIQITFDNYSQCRFEIYTQLNDYNYTIYPYIYINAKRKPLYRGSAWMYGVTDSHLLNAYLDVRGRVTQNDGLTKFIKTFEDFKKIFTKAWNYKVKVNIDGVETQLLYLSDQWTDTSFNINYSYHSDSSLYIEENVTLSQDATVYLYVTEDPYEGDAWAILPTNCEFEIESSGISEAPNSYLYNHTFEETMDLFNNPNNYNITVEMGDSEYTLSFDSESNEWHFSNESISIIIRYSGGINIAASDSSDIPAEFAFFHVTHIDNN